MVSNLVVGLLIVAGVALFLWLRGNRIWRQAGACCTAIIRST